MKGHKGNHQSVTVKLCLSSLSGALVVVIDPPERSSQSDHPAGFMEKPLSVLGNTCRMLHMDHVAEMASALNRGGGRGGGQHP